ncbi:hypothetical protein C4568_00205 [Candidatus Parcubacteria bacterium]|nr:MAG: hypothetical protein C4568_00205 [Candidatus Parcubacteria bacterium]
MEGLETESRQDSSKKLVDFLRRTGAPDFFQNVLAGSEKVPDFEQFKDFLTRINGIARQIPIKNRAVDGTDVEIRGFVDTVNVSRQEDKEPLLKYAYESASKINRDEIKYMLPAVVNAVHLFADGNGRTSRALHLLLREFPSEQERLQKIRTALGEDGRYDSYDVNPGKIRHEIEQIIMRRHGWTFDENDEPVRLGAIESGAATAESTRLDSNDPIQKMAKNFFRLYQEDVRYALTAIYEAIGNEGVQRISASYGGTNRISPLKMTTGDTALSEEEWQSIIDSFYLLKVEHVETLVNLFVEPDKYRTPDNTQTIKDLFIQEVEAKGL